MKKLSLLIGSVIILFGCSNIEKDWTNANKKNSIQAFVTFIEKHPDNIFLEEANKKILILKADSVYYSLLNKSSKIIEIEGEYKSMYIDLGSNSKGSNDFYRVDFLDQKDTIWLFYNTVYSYNSEKLNLGESYKMQGIAISNVDVILKDTFQKQLVEVSEQYDSLISTVNSEIQDFIKRESLNEVYKFVNSFDDKEYQTLSNIYLLKYKKSLLLILLECINNESFSFDEKVTMSFVVDTLKGNEYYQIKSKQHLIDFNVKNPLNLELNKERKNVKITESGLQYIVLKMGNGNTPNATSVVSVNYIGYLANGKVFDSSYKRGDLTKFPLNKVIEGWEEGLQLMQEGSQYIFYIPSNLAYGEREIGGMPANSPLTFIVELIKVENE